MSDLVTWLRAQLDEDERVARVFEGCCWHAEYCDETADFHDRFDPARVLAEVEAKRKILDLHDGSHECSTLRRDTDWDGNPTEEVDSCTWVAEGTCTTVQLLALPYADQEDYREEWRP